MAVIMRNIFQSRLYILDERTRVTLNSSKFTPEALKDKILVKFKRKWKGTAQEEDDDGDSGEEDDADEEDREKIKLSLHPKAKEAASPVSPGLRTPTTLS